VLIVIIIGPHNGSFYNTDAHNIDT